MTLTLPIGDPVSPHAARRPGRTTIAGTHIILTPLNRGHAEQLFERLEGHDEVWTYLPDGPMSPVDAFVANIDAKSTSDDPLFFALLDPASRIPLGYASFLRINPAHRVIEVGHILYTPALQRTIAATEAMYLMARHVFEDLGYRRYEWKCNALNAPSRSAALRLGFTFEGVFRQHMIVKGRNRDSAWFSMLDGEWPHRKAAFERWLSASNHDAYGHQRVSLSQIRKAVESSSPSVRT